MRNGDAMKLRHAAALALVVAIAMIAVSIQAGAADDTHPDSSTMDPSPPLVRLSGSINGILESTAGGCTQGFSNQCPSGHTCGCLSATDAKVSSPALGAGTAKLSVTVDDTSAFALGACAPVYAEIDVTAKKDSPTFNAVGGICFEPNGEAVLSGVMGLATTSRRFTTTGAVGYTAILQCTSGLCGGSFRLALSFKGIAK